MKFFCLLLAILSPLQLFSEDLTVLERAIHQLPAECLADLPTQERQLFIDDMLKLIPKNKCLDIPNQYLHYYSDGETPFHMSSMLYMKVFPDERGDIVLCHMPKPHADSNPPRLGQTFLFRWSDGRFVDVTDSILPKKVNRKWKFKPRRAESVIEIGPYEKTRRADGRGFAFIGVRPRSQLIWTGDVFELEKLKIDKYSYDAL